MDYSPKLKKAMLQIEEIINENDIAGIVCLHDKTGHGEYLHALGPSYSVISLRNGKIKLKASRNKNLKRIATTANMLRTLITLIGNAFIHIEPLDKALTKKFDIKHGGKGFIDPKTLEN